MSEASPAGGLAGFGASAERVAARFARTFGAALLVLTLLVVFALAVAAPVGYQAYGRAGLFASSTAAVVCWAASAAALFVTHLFAGTPAALSGLFMSIGLRTGLPLAAAAVLSTQSAMLADGGVFGFFVVFYLLSLAAETVLSVGLMNARKGVEKAS